MAVDGCDSTASCVTPRCLTNLEHFRFLGKKSGLRYEKRRLLGAFGFVIFILGVLDALVSIEAYAPSVFGGRNGGLRSI